MKKRIWALMVCLSMCLCAACGNKTDADKAGESHTPTIPQDAGPKQEEAEAVTMTCRVICEEDGVLLLAGQNGGAGDVYRIGTVGTEVVTESGGSVPGDGIEAGSLIEITYNGMIEESYPAAPGGITKIVVMEGGFDDLCELYLEVLEDLWEVDEGLNSDITELGIDLSRTRLSESEQAAVAWHFGEEHGIEPIEGTYDQLVEWGYINGEELYWENGCLFTIEEKQTEGAYSLNTVTFDAQKWRSGLGAYFFMDCTSVQSEDGEWKDYQIGAEAIS